MFILLALLANIYLFLRGWQALPKILWLRILYLFIFLIIIGSVFLGYYLNEKVPDRFEYPLRLLRRYYIVFMALFMFAAVLADTLRIMNHLFGIFPEWLNANYSQVKLVYFGLVILVTLLISVSGFRRYSNPEVVDLVLPQIQKNSNIGDLNIVAASDLHLGIIVRKDRMAAWTELLNMQDPDIILLVGDIFDHTFNPKDADGIIEQLSKLRAKYGVYAVPGNHEHYINLNKSLEYFNRAGIIVLRDKVITVDNRLVIIGRDDAHNRKRKPVDSLILEADTGLPVILMDHQPTDLHSSVKNRIDLHLSGHTHNGQIFPGNYLAKLKWELVHGYRKIEDSHFYVSSGLGLSYIPLRLGTRSEIVRISFGAASFPASPDLAGSRALARKSKAIGSSE